MNNKKLSIVFLVILFLFILTSSCFASIDFNYKNEDVSLPDIPLDEHCTSTIRVNPYILRWDEYWGCYSFWICKSWNNSTSYFYADNGDIGRPKYINFKDFNGNNGTFLCYRLDSDGKWKFIEETKRINTDGDFSSIAISSKDIYKDEEKSEIFFQVTSLTHLGEIVKEAEPQETIMEIVKILPLILVVVVSYLGLRKALRLLSMLLHQA